MTGDRLRSLRRLAPRMGEIEEYLQRAADPQGVVVGLQRLLEAGADPLPHIGGVLRLIDASPITVETLTARPALLEEVAGEQGHYERSIFERDLDAALEARPDLPAKMDHLRAVRVEETLRIAWQDVVEGVDLTVVTRRISDLAEILLERVLRAVQAGLVAQYGRPWHDGEPVDAAVVAMGKLGGGELNYSSDIDLIFLYGKDGETDGGPSGHAITNREFFHRLTERVTREVGAGTAAGRLYRVDLRLRPEGTVGSLARSLASSVAYYMRMGETWERQAFIKARCVAGDRRIGEEFVDSVRAWAYGRGLDFAEISALKRIKQRIEDVTITRGEERSEVKTGYGGIRDVEYVIQFLQLLHGVRNPQLRHHNSLTSLRLLENAGAILPHERDILDDAYRFLRKVEHRLQLVRHGQVHRIPDDAREALALARRCGFPDEASFRATYRAKAEAVRDLFNRLFRHLFRERDEEQVRETNLVLAPGGDPRGLAEALGKHGVRDAAAGVYLVEQLGRENSTLLAGSPRTRKFLADLFPRLLDAIAATPDADAALRHFEAITAGVGARATLYEGLSSDDRLLRLLVDIAGNSLFLTNILVRAPGVLDQLVDSLATSPDRGIASFEDIPTATVPSAPDPARLLSDYKDLEMLRIGLRDVRGEQSVRETGEDLSRLAEIIVRLACERARQELRTAGADLVVMALGKFGGRELLYGSDLDLVFFCRSERERVGASAMARRIAGLLGQPGAHGKLYEVDLRLRPGGSGGELVATPSGFRDYFERGIGQVWERMAYTRARAVAGPPTLCEEVAASIAETVYTPGFGAADARAMAEMRSKLARHAGPESIKRSRSGGVVDVEFVALMRALRHGREDPRYREGNVPRMIQLLYEQAAMEPQYAIDLRTAYRFLLSLESKIRIVADLPEDRLPEEQIALRALARRLGYVDTTGGRAEDGLREEYAYHRGVAQRGFDEEIGRLSV